MMEIPPELYGRSRPLSQPAAPALHPSSAVSAFSVTTRHRLLACSICSVIASLRSDSTSSCSLPPFRCAFQRSLSNSVSAAGSIMATTKSGFPCPVRYAAGTPRRAASGAAVFAKGVSASSA